MIPGRYELNKNLSVKSLIESAGGFKENALRTRAYIIRERLMDFRKRLKQLI